MTNRLRAMLATILALVGLAAAHADTSRGVTPAQWLQQQAAPPFRNGHTLPRLTRFGWVLPLDARIELAERWGYALEFGTYADMDVVERALTDPASDEAKVVALARTQPDVFKLAVISSRTVPALDDGKTFIRAPDWRIRGQMRQIWHPLAPERSLSRLADASARPIERLARVVKPALIINGGEYAIEMLGTSQEHLAQRPEIVAAKGARSWYDFISEQKSREQFYIKSQFENAVQENFQYVYYFNGGGIHAGRTPHWKNWHFSYDAMRLLGSYPSNAYYYGNVNDGWIRYGGGRIRIYGDLLTQALSAKGVEISRGDRFSYDWVCGGWEREVALSRGTTLHDLVWGVDYTSQVSDPTLYAGFLTSIYMAGTLGANAGYYALPTGGFGAAFDAAQPPAWLSQLAVLSRVHARFSYLERFVRNSQLLPGSERHIWGEHPAYEFASGNDNLRVLVRKHDTAAAWLVSAWSAVPAAREGVIDLPGYGRLALAGAPGGKVYLVRRNAVPEVVEIGEEDGANLVRDMPELF